MLTLKVPTADGFLDAPDVFIKRGVVPRKVKNIERRILGRVIFN
jgi:hypothetical protein